MRVARAVQAGRAQSPLFLYGANNIFCRKLASNAPLAADQTPALKLANQCNYANPNYSFDGSPAPSFYGYSGMGYGGYALGYELGVNRNSFNQPLYLVDAATPTQTITYVQSDGVTPQPPGTAGNLQNYFNAVPVPDVTKIPKGQIWPVGTDKEVCIWRPSTNEMWEMWKMSGSAGAYTFQYGGYITNVNGFNGIFQNLTGAIWGARACGLAMMGGNISVQDIIDVLRGGSINHAIGIALAVTANAHVAPANRHDSSSHTPQHQADGITPNPAFGFVDAVAEGTWCRLPASFNPAIAMPGAGPIALAIATAIRDYGLFVNDGSGTCAMYLEDTRSLGSPYSWAKVNPFAGSTGVAAGYYDTYMNADIPASWTDPTLPKITEVLSGPTSVVSKIPWQQLQVLQPFSS